MQTLTWADHRKISEFVRDLYCLDSVKAIFERVVQRLDTLIGGNSTIMILNESKADAPRILAENAGPEYQKLLPTAWALRHEHPGIRYHLAHRGRAVALADLLPLNQWKKTGLYNEVFLKLGMQEQLGASFPVFRPDLGRGDLGGRGLYTLYRAVDKRAKRSSRTLAIPADVRLGKTGASTRPKATTLAPTRSWR